jgi:hypothetical protein
VPSAAASDGRAALCSPKGEQDDSLTIADLSMSSLLSAPELLVCSSPRSLLSDASSVARGSLFDMLNSTRCQPRRILFILLEQTQDLALNFLRRAHAVQRHLLLHPALCGSWDIDVYRHMK